MPCSSAAAMTSSSRIEPPGWMTATAPASASTSRPSRNGKKASGGDDRTRATDRRWCLDAGDLGRIDAAHLAGADAQGHAAAAEDDGVGLDELATRGEEQVFDLLGGRLHLGDDLQAGSWPAVKSSAVCTSRPPPTRFSSSLFRSAERHDQHAQVGLGPARPWLRR